MKSLRPFFAASLLGLLLVAEIFTTNIYLVGEDAVEDEDVYVAANSARIDGVIDGDLVISTSRLDISGTVTGDVFVLSQGPVTVSGDIGGSLRGIARSVVVDGTVGDDVTIAAASNLILLPGKPQFPEGQPNWKFQNEVKLHGRSSHHPSFLKNTEQNHY